MTLKEPDPTDPTAAAAAAATCPKCGAEFSGGVYLRNWKCGSSMPPHPSKVVHSGFWQSDRCCIRELETALASAQAAVAAERERCAGIAENFFIKPKPNPVYRSIATASREIGAAIANEIRREPT